MPGVFHRVGRRGGGAEGRGLGAGKFLKIRLDRRIISPEIAFQL